MDFIIVENVLRLRFKGEATGEMEQSRVLASVLGNT